MAPIGKFHTASGARVVLGPEIGRGGEGTVYEVVGAPDLVAKVYTDGRADDRREKIEAMAAAGLHRQASHISFPIDVLLGGKGAFVGFTMRRIKGALPVHQLWGSRDRQEKFPDATVAFMVRVAGNAARAVGELHQAGCVIGDINESGFLVTDQATVVLIDSDSIQVTVGNRVFPCVVGTPQYLPPEHQEINQRQLGARTANHDNFGLAVLIFRLLMAGTHPFMGRWNGPGDPPALPKWIEEFRYAYGTDAARMKVGPQPAAPPVDWLSDEIRAAFNQAFGKSGVQARPTAADWIGVLDQFEKSLVACGRSRYHHHRPGVRSCPWCETEKTRGKALFGPPASPPPLHFQQTPFSVPPPGPTPSAPSTSPPATPINALRNTALAIVGVTIAAIWMFGRGETQAPRTAVQPTPQVQARESLPTTVDAVEKAWVESRPGTRIPELSDCNCQEALKWARGENKEYPNEYPIFNTDPYKVLADLNDDGLDDFVFVFLDAKSDEANISAGVAVFMGTANGNFLLVATLPNLGPPERTMLSYAPKLDHWVFVGELGTNNVAFIDIDTSGNLIE